MTRPCLLPLPAFVCIQWPCLLWHCFPPKLLQHCRYKPFSIFFHSSAAVSSASSSPLLTSLEGWCSIEDQHWSTLLLLQCGSEGWCQYYHHPPTRGGISFNSGQGVEMHFLCIFSGVTTSSSEMRLQVVCPLLTELLETSATGLSSPTLYHRTWTSNPSCFAAGGLMSLIFLFWPELVFWFEQEWSSPWMAMYLLGDSSSEPRRNMDQSISWRLHEDFAYCHFLHQALWGVQTLFPRTFVFYFQIPGWMFLRLYMRWH